MEMALFMICLCVLYSSCYMGHTAHAATFQDVATLHSNLTTGYNKYLRPLVDTSVPVTVYCSFQLVAIKELDEVNGKLSVVGFFTITWTDARLSWNPFLNNIFSLDLSESLVWTPEILLANPYDSLKSLKRGYLVTHFGYTGDAIWNPGDVISASCSLDMTYYPFDRQTCSLILTSWGYDSTQINLVSSSTNISLDYYTEHGTWYLLNTSAFTSNDNEIILLNLQIQLQRRSLFYTINIILPMTFMVALNLLVFILPVESGERLSYSITMLLSLAVFLTLVGETLPKTSKPMSILSYFLLADLILSTLICTLTICGLNLYFRDENDKPVPRWTRRIVCKCSCCQQSSNKNQVTKRSITGISQNQQGAWSAEEDQEFGITWKMVAHLLDNVVLAICTVIMISLKAAFFVITMSS